MDAEFQITEAGQNFEREKHTEMKKKLENMKTKKRKCQSIIKQ